MSSQAQIPTAAHADSRRFAVGLAAFYASLFGLVGTHLPFFPVWLKAIGIDAAWIGIITALPAISRFTALPFVTGLAERRQAVRQAIVITAFATAIGLIAIGTQHQAPVLFAIYAVTCCLWTPMTPLTDAYALRGVRRYGLNYGPLRLWGSAAFVAGTLACGLMIEVIDAKHLIWAIASVAMIGALVSLGLKPLETPKQTAAETRGDSRLLRDAGFLAIVATSALVQGSHAAYYTFASIAWQQAGYGGLTIAGLWVLGVLAEIVLFAYSPRFRMPFPLLIVIAALSAVLRWLITAQSPPIAVLAVVQLAHGLSFGLTQVATMGLIAQRVPGHVMARGQGYLVACAGIVTSTASIASGAIYSQYGERVYYLMAAMALAAALIMWLSRHRLAPQPGGEASGG
ncbi:MFS transporter [Bradyrhizobium sp.]|uniref:MFS transporter n=1 Tax=Bradyrhizobium sp. TaxID=376 RepID=UPI0040381C67